MKILLLGATGLLGRNVLTLLLEKKHQIVALVRNTHGINDIHSNNLTIIKGSLINEKDLQSAAKGCDAVINCAGTTDMSLLRYEDYLPINSELCKSMAKLAEQSDTKIIVHISTANTIGYGTTNCPGDEKQQMKEPFASSLYARSKREGEKYLEEVAIKHPECHIIILNPGFMIGAYDSKPSSGKLLLAGYRKPLMAVPKGGKSFVAVRDVAAAAINALTSGRSGERYLITGENLSLHDFYIRQAKVCGYRQCVITLPKWILTIAGAIGDIMRKTKIATQLSSNNIEQLSVMEYYTCKKAELELGLLPSSLDDAIKDFFVWRKENKQHKNKN